MARNEKISRRLEKFEIGDLVLLRMNFNGIKWMMSLLNKVKLLRG